MQADGDAERQSLDNEGTSATFQQSSHDLPHDTTSRNDGDDTIYINDSDGSVGNTAEAGGPSVGKSSGGTRAI